MTAHTRILIVDDETLIRRILRVVLKEYGYSVIDAATARSGLDTAALENPAAVSLDLGLPCAGGITVLRAIRGWSQVPVVVMSVRADEAGKLAALDAGAQGYVVKPFDIQKLLARLRSLLRDQSAAEPNTSVILIADLMINAAAHRWKRQASTPTDPQGSTSAANAGIPVWATGHPDHDLARNREPGAC